ncbi:MAG: hypothetical protein ACTTKY_00495 [Catonella sp.]
MKNRVNMSCLFSQSTEPISSNLVPVKLTLLHDDLNRNASSIGIDVIKKAESSLKNKPILAYIRKDENGEYDFAGHEVEITINDEGIKTTYLERPVGIIPESTKVEYISKDGKIYTTCTGYIYKDYSNETLELIEKTNGKCVSVELSVEDGHIDMDSIFHITEFNYLGVTILSDSRTPGMDENCRIELFGNLEDYEEFINQAKNDVFSFEQNAPEPVEPTSDPTPVEPATEPTEPVAKPTVDPEEPVVEPVVEPEEPKEPTTEPAEPTVEPEEPVVEPEPTVNKEDYSIFNELFDIEIKSLDELKKVFISTIQSMRDEINSLEEYKKVNESKKRESEVYELLSVFGINDDSIEELKEKALNFEIEVSDLEKELYVIAGKIAMNKKDRANFAFNGIALEDNKIKNTKQEQLYNGLLDSVLGYK